MQKETYLQHTHKTFNTTQQVSWYLLSRFYFLGVAIDSARSFVASWLTELTQPHSEDLEEKEIEEEKEHRESIEDIQSIEKS